MKVQCPNCKEIVSMDRFETSSDGLRFLCPECQEIHFIENKANLDVGESSAAVPHTEEALAGNKNSPFPSEASEREKSDQQRVCPKCGHLQIGGTSCHKCGLDFLRFDPSNLPQDPPEAASIWSDIEHNPEDRQLHEDFIAACNDANRLDYATRQYRIFSRLPGMAQISEKMQARILSLAQAQIMPGGLESSRDDPKKTSKVVMWLLFIAAMAGIGYIIFASSELLEKMY